MYIFSLKLFHITKIGLLCKIYWIQTLSASLKPGLCLHFLLFFFRLLWFHTNQKGGGNSDSAYFFGGGYKASENWFKTLKGSTIEGKLYKWEYFGISSKFLNFFKIILENTFFWRCSNTLSQFVPLLYFLWLLSDPEQFY